MRRIEAEIPSGGGDTAWSGQLIAGRENAHGVIALNLLAEAEEGTRGPVHWSYRAGFSPISYGRLGYSVELAGGLESSASHELLFGAGMQVRDNVLFKAGLGFGLTRESPDVTLRAGVVVQL